MMVWSLFVTVLMGLFVYIQKLYNLYSSFNHYRNYNAKENLKLRRALGIFLLHYILQFIN